MANRLDLHEKLCEILGSRNVYFNPPESVKMSYPAIVYSLSTEKSNNADNLKYLNRKAYKVTLIDKDPDSVIYDKLLEYRYSTFDTSYCVNNLYHFVFIIYV